MLVPITETSPCPTCGGAAFHQSYCCDKQGRPWEVVGREIINCKPDRVFVRRLTGGDIFYVWGDETGLATDFCTLLPLGARFHSTYAGFINKTAVIL